ALAFVLRLPGLVLLSSRDPVRTPTRGALRIDVPQLTLSEQRVLWQQALGPAAPGLNGHLEQLVTHFSLGQLAIESAAEHALLQTALATEDGAAEVGPHLWDACRTHARPHLDDLAMRIDSHATWKDLVLPKAQVQILRMIVAHKQHQATVHHRWGF